MTSARQRGKPLPSIGVNELTGDVKQYDVFFEALKQSCPVPIGFEQIKGGAKGYFHTIENRIAIQEGMSQVQTIKTAIHEMTHQKLHSLDPDAKVNPLEPKLTRNHKEVEAESVALPCVSITESIPVTTALPMWPAGLTGKKHRAESLFG